MQSVFVIQRDLEDYLARLRMDDPDQYAVRLANLYDSQRSSLQPEEDFLARMRRIRTVFFKSNRDIDRREFEKQLLVRLDRRYLKKKDSCPEFPGGVEPERQWLARERGKPRTIARLLGAFKRGVESRGVDSFWVSRKKGKLQSRPEQIGQSLLALYAKGVLEERGGLVLREFASGIGYIDMGIAFASTLHLLELKVLTTSGLIGVAQLGRYMHNEGRGEGWLVVFDARTPRQREAGGSVERVELPEGLVHVICIDINPLPPSGSGR